jgi:hypothetical protein
MPRKGFGGLDGGVARPKVNAVLSLSLVHQDATSPIVVCAALSPQEDTDAEESDQ